MYLTVKSSCAHQGLVKNICAVGCSQDNHTAVGSKTVHFCKELVQCVFSFIVRSKAGILASCPSYGVDFINKHDTGSLLFGLPEKIPDP